MFITGLCLESTASGPDFFCESCVYVKATRKPVVKAWRGKRAAEFGDEIHSDLWGPAPDGGKHYYVTFVDDNTHLMHLHLLTAKSETSGAYKNSKAWSHTQMKKPIKVLHSDQGCEYMGNEFVMYLKSQRVLSRNSQSMIHHRRMGWQNGGTAPLLSISRHCYKPVVFPRLFGVKQHDTLFG